MEAVKPYDDIEAEAEETGVALRGRLPRHHATTDDGPAIITTSSETFTASVVVNDDDDDDDLRNDDKDSTSGESRSSSDDEESTNDAKATTHGHSGIDDRYVDFLVHEENPFDHEKPIVEFEANDLVLSQKNGGGVVEVNHQNGVEIEKVEDLLPLPDSSASTYIHKENGGHETFEYMEARLRKKIEEEFKDLYLNKLSDDPEKHEFYCPNCKTCITKVLVRERELELETSAALSRPERVDGFRCTSCFSFLIPMRNWLFPKWSTEAGEPDHDVVPVSFGGSRETFLDHTSQAVAGKTTKPPLLDTDEIGQVQEQVQPIDSSGIETPHDHQLPVREIAGGTVVSAAITPSFETGVKLEVSLPWHDLKGSLPGKITPDLDQSNKDVLTNPIEVVAVCTGEPPMLQEVIVHGGSKPSVAGLTGSGTASEEIPRTSTVAVGLRDTRWEIVKSIVYGGLVESITSLGIVTSAASGDATTLNIVALALANLIGGLLVIAHNIWELRDDRSTVSSSIYNRMVDKYEEVLGRRENYVLHATLAILSFIVFGLVPPVVYGLTFRESNNKELKLAAVGVASLVCIAILAIGKAYIQRPNKYIKTIVYYLVTGFGVSGASYLAGELISKLLKKIESSDSTPALDLLFHGTGKSNPAWGSY